MEPLPDDVSNSLLRGVSAYLKATPTHELPAKLRRFQNFRPKALAAHRRQILDSLDDEALRALIVEWLDEKPSLAKADAAVLRTATERGDGWEDELAATAQARPAPPKASSPPDTSGRDREKLRKARDEARRRNEDAQREIRSLRAQVDELEAELEREKQTGAALERDAAAAQRAASKAATDLERERRKTRAAIERAEAATQKTRAELKETKRELQTMRRELDKTTASVQRKASPKPRPATPRGPRRALAVPKGRFEDDPETLEHWLDQADVHLLVDGYNASMSSAGFAKLDLATQRERLVEELTKLARRKKIKVTVVFDGSDVSSVGRRARGSVRVQYSAPDEIADDHLIALLGGMPPSPVVVATSDRELQERGAALGATIATSEQLLALLR